jgi:hypothetical protein
MNRQVALRVCVAAMLAAGTALLSAQVPQLPSSPQKQFGTSITPGYYGWYDNPDGTHNFLIGYFNRNTEREIDIPIGPNNKFEPGDPDRGQPTHFLPRRQYGMFVVTVPKDFPKTQKINWTLSYNGTTTTIPFYMHVDYNLTPTKSTEESPNGKFNEPPILRFGPNQPTHRGPGVTMAKAIARTATVGTPMPIEMEVDDDALYSSGGNAPLANATPVTVVVSKYRGPADVKIAEARPKFTTTKGGKALEDYSGKATTTATFSQPGEYVLHIMVGDLSGNGGGGSGCCWTNALMKVTVR